MPIPRSKSTPLVAASTSTSLSDASTNPNSSRFASQQQQEHRPARLHVPPTLQRHHSTTTLHTLKKSSSSLSGYHTPKTDEDPFSLAGFFPSHSALDSARAGWDWLRFDVEETLTEEPEDLDGGLDQDEEWYNGYTSPLSDDGSVPPTPGGGGGAAGLLSPAGDEFTRVAIEAQDKLGVLALRDLFMATDKDHNDGVATGRDARLMYGPLLSPYSEDGPADDDGLYSHLRALRQGYSEEEASAAIIPVAEKNSRDNASWSGLFSPGQLEEEEALDSKLAADVHEHETLVYQGLRRMLDMLPF